MYVHVHVSMYVRKEGERGGGYIYVCVYVHVHCLYVHDIYIVLLPLSVIPNPFACHFFLQNTYSEKPPGPAQISAK